MINYQTNVKAWTIANHGLVREIEVSADRYFVALIQIFIDDNVEFSISVISEFDLNRSWEVLKTKRFKYLRDALSEAFVIADNLGCDFVVRNGLNFRGNQ